jgi:hypothetical protein
MWQDNIFYVQGLPPLLVGSAHLGRPLDDEPLCLKGPRVEEVWGGKDGVEVRVAAAAARAP